MRHQILALVVAAILLASCGGGGTTPASFSATASVFAAASLTDAFKALGTSFQATHSAVTVQFNFAGTPTLVTQIEQGASADVFASADMANMDKLNADGFTSGASQVFAHNKLAIVVGAGNPKGITGLADLAKPGVIYITEAATVPAGKYALQILANAGVKVTPRSLETDVKSVVGKVALGEADAGIVYTTDVSAAGSRVQGVQIPDSVNVIATYPIVAIKGTRNADLAKAFIAYVLSADGQSKLQSFGFLPA
ncbi:MAG TPA: molybdate ABC transporter substrate-binding protein [Candidatus Dormibacteraeota bacterium]|jgi:molybdate transport system substrate-binding protein